MVDNSDKISFWVKSVSASIFVINWIVFFIIRNKSQNSLATPLTISILVSIISVGMFFWQNFIKGFLSKTKEDLKTTKVMSKERVTEVLQEVLDNDLWNHKRIGGSPTICFSSNKGKNVIYTFKVHLLYEEVFGVGDKSYYVYIIINASREDFRPVILSGNSSYELIEQKINELSEEPSKAPNIIKRRVSSDQFGRPVEDIEEKKYPEEEKKDKEKESVA